MVRSPRPLTPAQASEYWITLRRDWYWLDLSVPFDEAVRRACDEWAAIQTQDGQVKGPPHGQRA